MQQHEPVAETRRRHVPVVRTKLVDDAFVEVAHIATLKKQLENLWCARGDLNPHVLSDTRT
jgi:hypothetical protein